MDGLILVRKPLLLTSHDVVASLRHILSQQKIGHFGTLDPMASGLLLAAAGKATRLFPFFSKMNKSYEGRIRLGYSTDTYDATGQPSSEETSEFPPKMIIDEALESYVGEITQLPPPFSAKKYRGKPLYTYARRQKPVESRPFRIHIRSFRMLAYVPPYLDFEVECSSGTYIRTLAHDLGRTLGCGAHLADLVRTKVGEYQLQDGRTLEEIRDFHQNGATDRFLLPLEILLPTFPKFTLNETGVRMVKNGRVLSKEHFSDPKYKALPETGSEPQNVVRLFSRDGVLIALAHPAISLDHLSPFVVFI